MNWRRFRWWQACDSHCIWQPCQYFKAAIMSPLIYFLYSKHTQFVQLFQQAALEYLQCRKVRSIWHWCCESLCALMQWSLKPWHGWRRIRIPLENQCFIVILLFPGKQRWRGYNFFQYIGILFIFCHKILHNTLHYFSLNLWGEVVWRWTVQTNACLLRSTFPFKIQCRTTQISSKLRIPRNPVMTFNVSAMRP